MDTPNTLADRIADWICDGQSGRALLVGPHGIGKTKSMIPLIFDKVEARRPGTIAQECVNGASPSAETPKRDVPHPWYVDLALYDPKRNPDLVSEMRRQRATYEPLIGVPIDYSNYEQTLLQHCVQPSIHDLRRVVPVLDHYETLQEVLNGPRFRRWEDNMLCELFNPAAGREAKMLIVCGTPYFLQRMLPDSEFPDLIPRLVGRTDSGTAAGLFADAALFTVRWKNNAPQKVREQCADWIERKLSALRSYGPDSPLCDYYQAALQEIAFTGDPARASVQREP